MAPRINANKPLGIPKPIDQTANRAFGTSYVNGSRTRYLYIIVTISNGTTGVDWISINSLIPSIISFKNTSGSNFITTLTGIVPPGGSYTVTDFFTNTTLNTWIEIDV
jgi:hypothetical protein